MPGAEAMAPGTFLSTLLMLAVGAGLVAAIGIVVQVFRLANGHAHQAAPLVTRISDALILDPALGSLPVTVTAHARLWRRSPVTIEVGGQVPTLELREAALAVVWREVSTHAGGPYRVEDRVAIAGRPA